ncbi:MAG: serine hydrolase domain-containing protein [Fimbriimonadaceae bacterium]
MPLLPSQAKTETCRNLAIVGANVFNSVMVLGLGLILGQSPEETGPALAEPPPEVWDRPLAEDAFSEPLSPVLEEALNAAMDELTDRAPGVAAALYVPGEGMWSGVAGNVEQGSLLPVGSVTKMFTAVAAHALAAERDDLHLDKPLQDLEKPATLSQLLRHTSGMSLMSDKMFQFSPGEGFSYSNSGFSYVGRTLEDATGESLEEIFQRLIYTPAGLVDTKLPEKFEPRVPHAHVEGKPVDKALTFLAARNDAAAGALLSTPSDLVRFLHALLSYRLLPREVVQEMFTDMRPTPDATAAFGSGVMLYTPPQGPGPLLGHSGTLSGFRTAATYVVEDDIYVALVFTERNAPAEAGVWQLIQAFREARG